MGQAKNRGPREERVAKAVAEKEAWEKARAVRSDRKPKRTSLMLAAAIAAGVNPYWYK